MKTAEEILKEYSITSETKHHSYDYLYRSMIAALNSVLSPSVYTPEKEQDCQHKKQQCHIEGNAICLDCGKVIPI